MTGIPRKKWIFFFFWEFLCFLWPKKRKRKEQEGKKGNLFEVPAGTGWRTKLRLLWHRTLPKSMGIAPISPSRQFPVHDRGRSTPCVIWTRVFSTAAGHYTWHHLPSINLLTEIFLTKFRGKGSRISLPDMIKRKKNTEFLGIPAESET